MRIRHVIDGQQVDSVDGRTFESLTPIDNTVLAEVALGSAPDVDRAVGAARMAFAGWSRTPISTRKALLHRVADLIEERQEELAQWESRDMGVPIADMRAVYVPRSAEVFRTEIKSVTTKNAW